MANAYRSERPSGGTNSFLGRHGSGIPVTHMQQNDPPMQNVNERFERLDVGGGSFK